MDRITDIPEYGIIQKNDTTTVGETEYPSLTAQMSSVRSISVDRFTDPGVDAAPLPGDYVLSVPVRRSGGAASAGVMDIVTEKKATPGEHRAYARNPSSGDVVSEIHQHDDGTVEVKNDNGQLVLSPDGTITASNSGASIVIAPDGTVTLDATDVNISASSVAVDCPETAFTGTVTAPDFITESGISLKDHVHGGVQTGASQTGGPE